jgi:hypothetical protein
MPMGRTAVRPLKSAILTSPHPHPLEQQNAHRVSLSLLWYDLDTPRWDNPMGNTTTHT